MVEIKSSGSQCLGTGMTPSWIEISISYLDDTTFVWKPVSL
ncbi:hypothetical protein ACJZL1_02525 [Wolbachia endosymbiont of Rhagoletis indifferens]